MRLGAVWARKPGSGRRVARRNDLPGGFAVVWIPWGSGDSPLGAHRQVVDDLGNEETWSRNITVPPGSPSSCGCRFWRSRHHRRAPPDPRRVGVGTRQPRGSVAVRNRRGTELRGWCARSDRAARQPACIGCCERRDRFHRPVPAVRKRKDRDYSWVEPIRLPTRQRCGTFIVELRRRFLGVSHLTRTSTLKKLRPAEGGRRWGGAECLRPLSRGSSAINGRVVVGVGVQ